LQHWLTRKDGIDMDPEVVSFFESPAGTAFLHRLALAAHFVITMLGSSGVRLVCMFFELTGLDKFVASSYGTQYTVSVDMQEAIVQFDHEEKQRLAESMAPKDITVCQDETFHPETCLVAIEPASNFILLEKYADSRKSSEWTSAMEEAIKGLSVNIVQSTSDEGRGILCHVKSHLGAHHAPDLFHVQHEIVKGTSAVLASKKKKAQIALDQADKQVDRSIKKKQDYGKAQCGSGRPLDFDKRVEVAEQKLIEAQRDLDDCISNQKRMKEAIREIGRVYHPVDLETGKLKESDEISDALEKCFTEIETVASRANLTERSLKRITKAKKVVVEMVATILFFHTSIKAQVEALSLPSGVEKGLMDTLIPGLYIKRAARQAKTAEDRQRLSRKSCEILALLQGDDNPFHGLDAEEIKLIENTAQQCVDMFQRSSSCVEGRNGQLSLRHHSLHRLSNRKLAALTAVHNYFTKRRDGTTAAERFFGNRPREMFEELLSKIDLPGRPACRRS
jgi:hypothetical protein